MVRYELYDADTFKTYSNISSVGIHIGYVTDLGVPALQLSKMNIRPNYFAIFFSC